MKQVAKKLMALCCVCLLQTQYCFSQTEETKEKQLGPFSIGANKKVFFSPGNLQYNAALGTHQCADGTTKQGTWRFAEHQWDIVGLGYGKTSETDHNFVGGTVVDGNNRQVDSNYNGWIDLFCWGTSGWNSGANAYDPWSKSTTDYDYYPGGNYENNLTDEYAYADWGIFNQIGNDAPGTWRTLTMEEWDYLFNTRTDAGSKYGAAKVNDVTGVVVLPDVWTLPAGCTFTPGMTAAGDWFDWSLIENANIYSANQWLMMEANGAMFLPAAGRRTGAGVGKAGTSGRYWSSTRNDMEHVYNLEFGSQHLSTQFNLMRSRGRSVRLVKNITPPVSAYQPMPFSVAPGKTVCFSSGSLQYNAALGSHQCADGTTKQGTWRFAEHQWDMVGMGYGLTDESNSNFIGGTVLNSDNRLVSSTYNGWIDLFGWGTSGWNSGAKAYEPWSTSTDYADYYPGNSSSNNLTGEYAYADWGVYNQIGYDAPGTWRTLTRKEWDYLVKTRTDASLKYGAAKVNSVTGIVFLPDEWSLPEGCAFTPGMVTSDNKYDWEKVASSNIYTGSQWQKMEAAGAVFLPCAGGRKTFVKGVGADGYIWTSTIGNTKQAYRMYFQANYIDVALGKFNRENGRSVRLVKETTTPVSAYRPMPFSVAPGKTVCFSSGSLQYNAALGTHQCADGTTKQGTWRFAEHQWDMVGMGYGQTDETNFNYIGGTILNSDNRLVSTTYNGWIDLFGWGTSGWNSGAKAYEPWSTSTDYADYYPGNSSSNNLTGEYAYADWGVYNQVGNDAPETWRTLTYDEWDYLLQTRTDASLKYGAAKVNGMGGLVILPDEWSLPEGCAFTPGMAGSNDLKWNSVASTNIYTASRWQLMEAAGAVFLPAAGYRNRTAIYDAGADGYYWSATQCGLKESYRIRFYSGDLYPKYDGSRYYGRSVRLVKDTVLSLSAYQPMPFSVADGMTVLFSSGNLQYNAVLGTHQCADGTTQQGTWRFADNQWDIVGKGLGLVDNDNPHNTVGGNVTNADNRKAADNYNGLDRPLRLGNKRLEQRSKGIRTVVNEY